MVDFEDMKFETFTSQLKKFNKDNKTGLIGGFNDNLIYSYSDELVGGKTPDELKVYQIKDLIPQFLDRFPDAKIKAWKSKKKAELIALLKELKINPDDYVILEKNPKPYKRYAIGDVRKKYNKKEYTDAEQQAFLLELSNNPRYSNPLQALGQYTNKEGEREYLSLQEHQRKFIRQFIFSNLRGAIAFHGVGSGKTLSAVVSAYYYLKMYPSNSVIVVSPSSLLYNFINGMVQYGLDIGDKRYKFYTYDKYIRKPTLAKNALLIIDEAHNFRTEIVVNQAKDPETGQNLDEGIPVSNIRGYKVMKYGSDHAHKVLLLTGTVFVNMIYDIENLLAIVDNRDPITRSTFAEVISPVNAENIPDYFKYRISYFPTPKSDLFPTRNDIIQPIYMNKKQEEQYNKLKLEGRQELESDNPNAFYSAERYASNIVNKDDEGKIILNPKIDWIIKKIKEKKNEKFIIYSSLYDAGVSLLFNQLDKSNIKYAKITGSQSTSSKEENKRLFNGYDFGKPNFFNKVLIEPNLQKYINSDYRLLIITKAGAEGVDTINCQNMVLLDSQWNEALSEQIIARAIRYKSHHGLPKEERFVNVYRLLLVREANKQFVDKIKQKGFNDWIELHKEIKEGVAENIKIAKIEEQKYIPTVKELKELQIPNKGEKYIPEKTLTEKRRGAIGKPWNVVQITEDGWDKYKELKTDDDKKRWRVKIMNNWFIKYGKKKNLLVDKSDNVSMNDMTIDLRMFIISKSKQKNIDDFTKLLGNDISLFENYQSKFLPIIEAKIKELEKKMKRKLTTQEVDETEAKLYAELLSKENIQALEVLKKYENNLKKKRGTQAELQQYFTNEDLAKYLRDKSSIKSRKDKVLVLEPSAGDGALIKPILELKQDINIDMVEIDPKNRGLLQNLVKENTNGLSLLEQKNFLKFIPSKRYDYIYMNPPFHLRKSENALQIRDIWDLDFVRRAFGMLKKDGELLAITSQHFKTNDPLSKEFIQWTKLPDKAFNYEIREEKFSSNVKLNIVVMKILKVSDMNDSVNLGVNLYNNNAEVKGLAILQNIAPIEPPKATPIVKPVAKPKIIPQPEIPDVPELPQQVLIPEPPIIPKNIENKLDKIKNLMRDVEKEGKRGAVVYDASSFLQIVVYIGLLIKYDRKCVILDEDLRKLTIGTSARAEVSKKTLSKAETIANDLLDCIERGEKLIAIPLRLEGGTGWKSSGHANMLIYRPYLKTIERFEPHGQRTGTRDSEKDNEGWNSILKQLFEVKMKPYLKEFTPKFITPNEICPVIKGFQSLEGMIKGLTKEDGGFCGMWSAFALELMFLNPELTTKEILEIAFDIVKDGRKEDKEQGQYLKDVIRGYVLQSEKIINDFINSIDNKQTFKYDKNNKPSKELIKNGLIKLLTDIGSKSSLLKVKEIDDITDPLEKILRQQSKENLLKFFSTTKYKVPKNWDKDSIISWLLIKGKNNLGIIKRDNLINFFTELKGGCCLCIGKSTCGGTKFN